MHYNKIRLPLYEQGESLVHGQSVITRYDGRKPIKYVEIGQLATTSETFRSNTRKGNQCVFLNLTL